MALNYINEDYPVDKIAGKIEEETGSRVLPLKADVSKEGEVKKMFSETINRLGTVDILVNNAGIQKDEPFDEKSLEKWQKVLDVNLTGQFLCSRQPGMKKIIKFLE
ncbi:MAG: SDR family NAD(P)-dependent oxidoreductase [Elusimicrobiota bacterium]